jgi:sterol desaturase/sphingolipid hydroxylase (fatty acid hydroxylase superfamily)
MVEAGHLVDFRHGDPSPHSLRLADTPLIDSFKSLLSSGANLLSTSPRATASALLDSIIRMSTTKANYWLEFAFTSSLATALLAAGLAQHNGSWLDDFLTVMVGLLAFSFIEYVFHRWIFHGPESMYRRGHDAHHIDPHGYDALPFFLPSAILLGLTLLFAIVMPASNACLLGGAIAVGYVAYGLSHFAIHATRFRLPWLRQWAARHHVHHHNPNGNFGVTTPLWDYVLGTRYERKSRPR